MRSPWRHCRIIDCPRVPSPAENRKCRSRRLFIAAQITAIFSGARCGRWHDDRKSEGRGRPAARVGRVGADCAVGRRRIGSSRDRGRVVAGRGHRKIAGIHRGRDYDRARHLRLYRLPAPVDSGSRRRPPSRAAGARCAGRFEAGGDAVLFRLRPRRWRLPGVGKPNRDVRPRAYLSAGILPRLSAGLPLRAVGRGDLRARGRCDGRFLSRHNPKSRNRRRLRARDPDVRVHAARRQAARWLSSRC